MQVRRLRLLVVSLAGLCFLAGLALLVTVLTGAGREPVYNGKSVSVWFREYAFASNPPVSLWIISARLQSDGRIVLVSRVAGGEQVTTVVSTDSAAVRALTKGSIPPFPMPVRDSAWDALQAMGSNAVPYLVSQLRGIPFEPTYTRVFTNLPALLQKNLPNPGEKYCLRVRALDALGGIGDPSGIATPVLLDLLKKRERALQLALFQACRRLGVDRRLIEQVMIELAAKGRHDAVVEIAENLGWHGDDVAKLLGSLLKSSDAAMRRRAIVLLEQSGVAAAPALRDVLMALKDSDAEVRYLATRTLAGMGASTPEVADALRAALSDSNGMVQTVARRILARIAAEANSPDLANP